MIVLQRLCGTLSFITCGYGLLATVFFFAFAKASVGLFTSDPAVVLLGSQYLRGYICDTALAGVHFCFTGYFCAYGRAAFAEKHLLSFVKRKRSGETTPQV